MLDNITISKYYFTKSDIHDLNPLAKLICLLLFVISTFLINNLYILSILLVFETIIIMVTNIPIKLILKNILSLKYLIAFIIIINLLSKISILTTIILIIKLISILIYTNLFIYTTTPYSILKGLNQFLKPLSYLGFNTQNISLMISLSLRFIPVTIKEASKIYNSLVARGLSTDSSLKEKILGLKCLIFPMYILSFKRADNLSDMMELKLYNSKSKLFDEKIKWNYLDILFVVIHAIIMIVTLKEVL